MMWDNRLGNTPRWFITPPKDYGMRVPDEILRSVAFIQFQVAPKRLRLGTGFFVAIQSEASEFPHTYLVTARHVVSGTEDMRGEVRLNSIDGKLQRIPLEPPVKWWFHPTEPQNVDVAVLPFPMPFATFDFDWIHPEDAVTDELMLTGRGNGTGGDSIGVGDEVFIIGLFTKMRGRGRILPIVRIGNIAMLPPEPIPSKQKDEQGNEYTAEVEAYLVEARSIGGLSGSPVFVWETVYSKTRPGTETRTWYWFGLVRGHWDVDPRETFDGSEREEEGTLEGDFDTSHEESANDADNKVQIGIHTGIGIVVPVRKIMEVLNQKGLQDLREASDREVYARQGWVDDEAPDNPSSQP